MTARRDLPGARHGFAVRRLDELLPPARGREWDVRFVTATLLFYGLVGAAFFLVDWLNVTADDDKSPTEITAPLDDARDPPRTPYMMRLPRVLKDRDASQEVPESR